MKLEILVKLFRPLNLDLINKANNIKTKLID